MVVSHASRPSSQAAQATIVRAGLVLGVGLSMFFDGIVLHQILQWHHLVSEWYKPRTIAAVELNTLWDGLFHAAAWLVVLLGLVLLWRARRDDHATVPTRALVGGVLMGWGGFNIVENLLNHFLFGLHHVREGAANPLVYDVVFLLLMGVLTFAVGWAVWRSARLELRERDRASGQAA